MLRSLLDELGITPEQLIAGPATATAVPTFAEYVPLLSEAVPPGSRKVYGPLGELAVRQRCHQRRMLRGRFQSLTFDTPPPTCIVLALAPTKRISVSSRRYDAE
jgi:hypothetical protein